MYLLNFVHTARTSLETAARRRDSDSDAADKWVTRLRPCHLPARSPGRHLCTAAPTIPTTPPSAPASGPGCVRTTAADRVPEVAAENLECGVENPGWGVTGVP